MEPCVKLDPAAFVADPELIDALEKRANPVSCAEDTVLFTQGDEPHGLYILHGGQAYLTMAGPTGEPVLCMQPFDGSILGLPAVIGSEPYSLTAQAIKGATLSYVRREDFRKLLEEDPQLPMKVLHVLAAEVRAARQALR
jgi:CRP-like cAMP-binding protein